MGVGAWFPHQTPNLIKQSETKPSPLFSHFHITIIPEDFDSFPSSPISRIQQDPGCLTPLRWPGRAGWVAAFWAQGSRIPRLLLPVLAY